MVLDEAAMIAHLKERQGSLSLRAFSSVLGVSAAYLSDIYLGKRAVGKTICGKLGFRREKTTVTTMRFIKSRNAKEA